MHTETYCECCKDRLIEEYRDINVDWDYDWYDCVYDDFKADMKEKGIYVESIYFSGFWSQGDGACFEGSVDDWDKFLDAHGYDMPLLRKLREQGGGVGFYVRHSGRYYHEYCTTSSFDIDTFYDVVNARDDLTKAVVEALDSELEAETDGMETNLLEIFRGYMKGLYRSLEHEYDYLTSDEVVWESILASELYECDCEDELAEAA